MRRTIAHRIGVLGLALFLAAGSVVYPEEEAKNPFELLNELIQIGFDQNPALMAARLRWKSAIEQIPQAKALPDPRVTYFSKELDKSLGTKDYSVRLNQEFPFFSKLYLQGKVASSEAEKMLVMFQKETQDVVMDLKKSVFELSYIDQAIQTVEANRQFLDRIASLANTDYAAGRLTLFDVMKAESQRSQLEYDRILMEELRQTEVARVNAILHRPEDTEIPRLGELPAPPLDLDVHELESHAQENRAENRMARAEVLKKQNEKALAKKTWFPDFGLELEYFHKEDDSDPLQQMNQDDLSVGIAMTLPLWFRKNNSMVRGAQSELSAAEKEMESQQDLTRSGLKRIYFQAKNSERLVRLYRDTLVPQAERSLDVSETLYRQKGQGFSDILEAQSIWYNFRLAQSRAAADYNKNLAELERWVGSNLSEMEAKP